MKYDIDTLCHRCLADIGDFRRFGTPGGFAEEEYIFRDNNSPILGVAHLDTVFDDKSHDMFVEYKNKTGSIHEVISPRLDDRLGAYVLLDLLPRLGITLDILLTTGEEHGASTADIFAVDCKKKYNWIVEFDRAGTDVVTYQYGDETLDNLLKNYGFKLGCGSFSDISVMDELGCKAFNVGIGYHAAHTTHCYANLGELTGQIRKFARFYKNNRDVFLPHQYEPLRQAYTYGWGGKYEPWWDRGYSWSKKDDGEAENLREMLGYNYDEDDLYAGGKEDDDPIYRKPGYDPGPEELRENGLITDD
ncbi:MAG: hypothetical protein HF312_15705 [Ignavibacteria bacterium]|jgi:hypothetical protein|nr:hypothetical protein [Ignavibacteria bacterium]